MPIVPPCSACVICRSRRATHLSLPCRHLSLCDLCVLTFPLNTPCPVGPYSRCNIRVLHLLKLFPGHPNTDFPCSRCTICLSEDSIWAGLPSGSFELGTTCLQNMVLEPDLVYSAITLAHGDVALLARIRPVVFSGTAPADPLPHWINVTTLPNGRCRLAAVAVKPDDEPGLVFSALGFDLFLDFLQHVSFLRSELSSTGLKPMFDNVAAKTDKHGNTLLHIASQRGLTDVVKKILSHPRAIPDRPNHIGATPLYLAAERGHLETVHLLLEQTVRPFHFRLRSEFDQFEAVLYYSQPDANKTHSHTPNWPRLWPAFFNTYRPQLDANTLITRPAANSMAPPLFSTPYSIAVLRGHTAIVELFHQHPLRIDPHFHRGPYQRHSTMAEAGPVHGPHPLLMITGPKQFHLDIEDFVEDGQIKTVSYSLKGRPTTTPLNPLLPLTPATHTTVHFAHSLATFATSTNTGLLVYADPHAVLLRYFGNLVLNKDDELVPHGLGVGLASPAPPEGVGEGKIMSGRWEMGHFVEEKGNFGRLLQFGRQFFQ